MGIEHEERPRRAGGAASRIAVVTFAGAALALAACAGGDGATGDEARPLATVSGAVGEDLCGTCTEGSGGCVEYANGIHTWQCEYSKPAGSPKGTPKCWHPSDNTKLCPSGNCVAGECICTPTGGLTCAGLLPGATIPATDCGTPVEGAAPVELCDWPGCYEGACIAEHPPVTALGGQLPTTSLTAVRALRAGKAAVGGPQGLYERTGGAWTTPIAQERQGLVGASVLLAGPAGRTLAFTTDGVLVRTAKGSWVPASGGLALPPAAGTVIAGTSNGHELWVLANDPDALWHFDGATWSIEGAATGLWSGPGEPRLLWAPAGGAPLVAGTAGLACTIIDSHCVPVPGLSVKAGGLASPVHALSGSPDGALVLAVKDGHVLRRSADGSWKEVLRLAGPMARVHVSGTHEAWAWSQDGLWHYAGFDFEPVASPTGANPGANEPFVAMDCRAPSDCWAVNGTSRVFHWDGAGWTEPTATDGVALLNGSSKGGQRSLLAPSDDVLFILQPDTSWPAPPTVSVQRLILGPTGIEDTALWTLPLGPTGGARLVGAAPDDVYATANGLSHFDGKAWTAVPLSLGQEEYVAELALVGTRLWVGLGWTSVPSKPAALLTRASADAPWQKIALPPEAGPATLSIAASQAGDGVTVVDTFNGLWSVQPDGTVTSLSATGLQCETPEYVVGAGDDRLVALTSPGVVVSDLTGKILDGWSWDATSLIPVEGSPGVLLDMEGSIYEVGVDAGAAPTPKGSTYYADARPWAHIAAQVPLFVAPTPGGDLLVVAKHGLYRVPAPWKVE